MTYIKNVKTLEELKKSYKKLALKLHPDCGGSDEEMAQLNNEYDDLFEKLKNTHKNKEGETYTKETNETVEQFKDIINYLFSLKMENVSVEIVGSFIWLTGNTKPYKDEIKKLEAAQKQLAAEIKKWESTTPEIEYMNDLNKIEY